MIHIKKGYDITVLVVIKSDPDLVKNQLGIKPRGCFISFTVHNNLTIISTSSSITIQ